MITLKTKYKKDSHHSLNIDKIFIVRNALHVVAYIIRYAFHKNVER